MGDNSCGLAMKFKICSYGEVCSVIWFVWVKYVSPIKVYCQLIKGYDENVAFWKVMQKVKSGWISQIRMDMNEAQADKQMLENHGVTIHDLSAALDSKGCSWENVVWWCWIYIVGILTPEIEATISSM